VVGQKSRLFGFNILGACCECTSLFLLDLNPGIQNGNIKALNEIIPEIGFRFALQDGVFLDN